MRLAVEEASAGGSVLGVAVVGLGAKPVGYDAPFVVVGLGGDPVGLGIEAVGTLGATAVLGSLLGTAGFAGSTVGPMRVGCILEKSGLFDVGDPPEEPGLTAGAVPVMGTLLGAAGVPGCTVGPGREGWITAGMIGMLLLGAVGPVG